MSEAYHLHKMRDLTPGGRHHYVWLLMHTPIVDEHGRRVGEVAMLSEEDAARLLRVTEDL